MNYLKRDCINMKNTFRFYYNFLKGLLLYTLFIYIVFITSSFIFKVELFRNRVILRFTKLPVHLMNKYKVNIYA